MTSLNELGNFFEFVAWLALEKGYVCWLVSMVHWCVSQDEQIVPLPALGNWDSGTIDIWNMVRAALKAALDRLRLHPRLQDARLEDANDGTPRDAGSYVPPGTRMLREIFQQSALRSQVPTRESEGSVRFDFARMLPRVEESLAAYVHGCALVGEPVSAAIVLKARGFVRRIRIGLCFPAGDLWQWESMTILQPVWDHPCDSNCDPNAGSKGVSDHQFESEDLYLALLKKLKAHSGRLSDSSLSWPYVELGSAAMESREVNICFPHGDIIEEFALAKFFGSFSFDPEQSTTPEAKAAKFTAFAVLVQRLGECLETTNSPDMSFHIMDVKELSGRVKFGTALAANCFANGARHLMLSAVVGNIQSDEVEETIIAHVEAEVLSVPLSEVLPLETYETTKEAELLKEPDSSS